METCGHGEWLGEDTGHSGEKPVTTFFASYTFSAVRSVSIFSPFALNVSRPIRSM
jgi:hypothetical protein